MILFVLSHFPRPTRRRGPRVSIRIAGAGINMRIQP